MELAETPAAPTTNRGLSPPQCNDGGASGKIRRWARPVQHIAAAIVVPILYLLFIDRYAVNSFSDDDWSVVPLVHGALHGHLSLSLLWSQHNESRLVIGNLIDVLFGFTNRLDARVIIFFSAAIFVASYVGLLLLVRRYLPTRLTPISVLVVGVVWLSLADVQNALWAFQLSWYLTAFFFVMMLCALLNWRHVKVGPSSGIPRQSLRTVTFLDPRTACNPDGGGDFQRWLCLHRYDWDRGSWPHPDGGMRHQTS